MELVLFTKDGILFLLRWIHFLAGVTWIGHLYYFNFVQGEFFKEVDANVKNVSLTKLAPKALWWFRWGAMFTLLSGIGLLVGTMHTGVPLNSTWGVLILIGGGLGILMWANVWFVIWPAQKVVIESANRVLSGGQAIPDAANRGARALVASRTNVMFSIPMLFFMGAARHLPMPAGFETHNFGLIGIVVGILVLILQANALKGKVGPLATIRGVIIAGFALTAAIWTIVRFVG